METIRRSSGVLAPIFTLPGVRDVGSLGRAAFLFVDFLSNAKQEWLQTTPINPIDSYGSPYAGRSAFACETLYLDLEEFYREGLLDSEDVERVWRVPRVGVSSAFAQEDARSERIDYRAAFGRRAPLWKKAFERYRSGVDAKYRAQEERFVQENRFWLDDYALFQAIGEKEGGVFDWSKWPLELRRRDPATLKAFAEQERDLIDYLKFLQLAFDSQWRVFREYCQEKGVKLFGDVPIYVGQTSADVWTNPELFQVDSDGRVIREAGVPADDFNPDGQRWSSPLYRWEKHRENNFDWWKRRMKKTLERFDVVRLDHFIGFYNYYSFPGRDYENETREVSKAPATSKDGRIYEDGWEPGPQEAFFDALFEELPPDAFVAEDLGVMNDGVRALRDKYGLSGMLVLQFSFDGVKIDRKIGRAPNPLDKWTDRYVAYTGTHDGAPILGWLDDARRYGGRAWSSLDFRGVADVLRRYRRPDDVPAKTKRGLGVFLRRAFESSRVAKPKLGVSTKYRPLSPEVAALHRAALRAVAESPCRLAIFPLQDVVGLSNDARINFPGVGEGNWTWRLADGVLTENLASDLRKLKEESER